MQCRICLLTGVDLYSVFHIEKDVSYATMIMSVAAVKIEETRNNLICYICIEKLKYLYEFKNLIENTDFQLNYQIKRLTFNNIHDIIVSTVNSEEVEPTNNVFPNIEDASPDVNNINEINILSHNDSVIKKVRVDHEEVTEPLQETNPLTRNNILNISCEAVNDQNGLLEGVEKIPQTNDTVHIIKDFNSEENNLNSVSIKSYNDYNIKNHLIYNNEAITEHFREINHNIYVDNSKQEITNDLVHNVEYFNSEVNSNEVNITDYLVIKKVRNNNVEEATEPLQEINYLSEYNSQSVNSETSILNQIEETTPTNDLARNVGNLNVEVNNFNKLNTIPYNDLIIKKVNINSESGTSELLQEVNHNISDVYHNKEIEEVTPTNDFVHNFEDFNSDLDNLNVINIIPYTVIKKVEINNKEKNEHIDQTNHNISDDSNQVNIRHFKEITRIIPTNDLVHDVECLNSEDINLNDNNPMFQLTPTHDSVIKNVRNNNKGESTETLHGIYNSSKMETNSKVGDFKSSLNLRKTISKKKKKHKKKCKLKIKVTEKPQIKSNVCIKPVYLKDLRIISCRKGMKRKPDHEYRKKRDMCPYCGKLVIVLKKHILLHTAEKIYKCSDCDHRYYEEHELIRHTRIHTSPSQFKCDHCTAVFNQKGSLVKHMILHQNNKMHICKTCSKAFKWLSGLNRHMLIHGAKAVACDVCHMTFLTKGHLTNHMRAHSKERPYICEICNQTYKHKRVFNKHCFETHGIFVKYRSVTILSAEVLEKEKANMGELILHVQNFLKDGQPLKSALNPFTGPQATRAFEKAVKELQINNKLEVDN